jgi:mono/diheme cytochrome c family protein
MRERDVLLRRANMGPEASKSDVRLLVRRIIGRVLLAASVLLVLAGVPGFHARAASSADRAAGAELFKQNGCEHCHGADGIGTDRGPSLMTVGKRLHRDQIQQQILDGGKQMPPFKDVLNDEETRELVDYLAHKKKASKPVPGS